MSIISYAQNFEDVMLYRALKDIEQGFYIDVGANDPEVDSVTKAFYDRGWRGINIEPVSEWHGKLQQQRPRDINLQVAVGAEKGEVTLYQIPQTGLSTTDKNIADRHKRERGYEITTRQVPVRTLTEICQQYHVAPIHFLKIDVEGGEKSVLEGLDFNTIRPWIIVIESTLPNTQTEDYQAWEQQLLSAEYQFAYLDGLNRFYVANEYSNLVARLQSPPNVFDGFQLAETVPFCSKVAKEKTKLTKEFELRLDQNEHQLAESQAALQQARKEGQELTSLTEQREAELQRVQAQLVESQAALQQARKEAQELTSLTEQREAELQGVQAQLTESHRNAYHWRQEADAKEFYIRQIHSSTSWVVTMPLRSLKRGLDYLFQLPVKVVRTLLRPLMVWSIKTICKNQKIKNRLSFWLKSNYPNTHLHLRKFATSHNIPLTQALQKREKKFGYFRRLFGRSARGRAVDSKSQSIGVYSDKKVAVLAPVSSSGVTGGAERFYTGLVKAIEEQGCQVQLVSLEVDESSFENIQKAYKEFAELDLQDYDLVISTKAPTYVINHPNHVLYLVHTIRVFYDMFKDSFPDDAEWEERRQWIHEHDNRAFSRIQHRFSIGKEVSNRLRKWNACDAEVLHPPLGLDGFYDEGIGNYFFMPGRLHKWKRVDVAIKAIKNSSLPIRLLIAGEGEAELELLDLADGDPRIEFLGRVDDEALKRYYAGALAVPFLPIHEDYGYITLEAFASGKPVITCHDSGEPTTFVRDGVSGFICNPDPRALCNAFEKLWEDRALAQRMGEHGRQLVEKMNWKTVAKRLLHAGFPDIRSQQHHLKVAVLDMQPITPAVGGGRIRLLGLYHALGKNIQVRYVGSYDWPGEKYRRHQITPSLEEIDVPLSQEHHKAAKEAAEKSGAKVVIDMLFPKQAHLSPDYLSETFQAVNWADIIVFSHPWVAPLIDEKMLHGKTVIYDAQNVEADLRAQILDANNQYEREVLDEVERAERIVGERADLVLACSESDIDGFIGRYDWPSSHMIVVPNGVFSSKIIPPLQAEKKAIREKLNIAINDRICFFIGSDYAPNLEAATYIVEQLATNLPEIKFVIGGGVCGRLSSNIPDNVQVLGSLDEAEKLDWLYASDMAINPMFSGSGTNIKMFDFMSAGLPVVSSPIGARGIAQSTGVRVVNHENLAEEIRMLTSDEQTRRHAGDENRRLIEENYAWETISPSLGHAISSMHIRKQGKELLEHNSDNSSIKVAHLTTMGLKCGIGEYTRKLVDVYKSHNISNLVLTAETPDEKPDLSGIEAKCYHAWFYDNAQWVDSAIEPSVLNKIQEWGATHLVIQYHPGFFSPEMLLQFTESVLHRGIHVTVILHNFVNACASELKKLNELGVTLISHRMTEVQQGQKSYIDLQYMPLAVDHSKYLQRRNIEGRDWTSQPPIFVTTGFLRKHKGLVKLIQSMEIVVKQYPRAKLLIQCAEYPSEDSREELKACKNEISTLGLENNVVLDSRFLDREVIAEKLTEADIAVLPYEGSNEGGSAAANDCISLGLPLVVSQAEIFDQLRNVAYTVESDKDDIAHGILNILSDTALYAKLSDQAFDYAMTNAWTEIAGSFLVE